MGLDKYSVDEFNGPEQSPVYVTDDPSESNYKDSTFNVTDPDDWSNNDIDDVCALVDTGAMVTCTGTKHYSQLQTLHQA